MESAENISINERFRGEGPEIFDVAPVTDFDSYAQHLLEAERDYKKANDAFWQINPGSEAIMQEAENVESAAKVLYSRVQVIFLMAGAAPEDKAHAREILDMLTKDSSKREIACNRLYHKVEEVHPDQKERLKKLLKAKQKRMKFLDRCMATQAHYQKDQISGKDAAAAEQAEKVRRSWKAERTRRLIPAGGRFCPPRIFPHDPLPENGPVPWPPEVYLKFKKMEPEELVFNMEHYNFELPPDYQSEDGRMDGQSIVWDYDNHKVIMKYKGEEPVIWDFRQYIDYADTPRPGDKDAEYYLRLDAQFRAKKQGGILIHY